MMLWQLFHTWNTKKSQAEPTNMQDMSHCTIMSCRFKGDQEILERMRAPVREAFSYGIRHVIRHVYWDSVSYDIIRVRPRETIPRIIPRIPQYGVWYLAECMHWNSKKSVVNHFKNRLKLWLWKKNVSHKSHSVYLMNKRGERSSQSYYKSNVSPYGSFYHSFCMRSSGVWNWRCVLPNWWRYGVWYVVVRYEWMIRTASCRMNHTLVRHYAGRTKLN